MSARRWFTVVVLWVVAVLAANVTRADVDQPIYAIDSPTAGILAHREYHLQGRIGPESSITVGLRAGFFGRIHLGASFGMQRVLERAEVSVNDRVGFQARVRLLDERETPGVAVGFSSQGVGRFDEGLDRYERKSPGFYGVLSKNWMIPVGDFSLHGGVSYSLETDDLDDELNGFAAAEWLVFRSFSLVLDASGAFNDNREGNGFGGGGVYVDGAVRVNYGENLSMMLVFRDLTGNFESDEQVAREFEIALVNSF
jgi:hypothetical protein